MKNKKQSKRNVLNISVCVQWPEIDLVVFTHVLLDSDSRIRIEYCPIKVNVRDNFGECVFLCVYFSSTKWHCCVRLLTGKNGQKQQQTVSRQQRTEKEHTSNAWKIPENHVRPHIFLHQHISNAFRCEPVCVGRPTDQQPPTKKILDFEQKRVVVEKAYVAFRGRRRR